LVYCRNAVCDFELLHVDVWAWQSYMQVCIFPLPTDHKGGVLLNDLKQCVCHDFASSHDQMALVDDLIFVTVLENWNLN
jgi:hypothetical protein